MDKAVFMADKLSGRLMKVIYTSASCAALMLIYFGLVLVGVTGEALSAEKVWNDLLNIYVFSIVSAGLYLKSRLALITLTFYLLTSMLYTLVEYVIGDQTVTPAVVSIVLLWCSVFMVMILNESIFEEVGLNKVFLKPLNIISYSFGSFGAFLFLSLLQGGVIAFLELLGLFYLLRKNIFAESVS